MARWDVFHADRLELQRDLDDESIRAAFARGELRDDDLVRPAGTTTPWARLADFPELLTPPTGPPAPSDFEEIRPDFEAEPPAPPHPPRQPTEIPDASTSDVAFPVLDEEITAPPPSPAPSPDDRRAVAAATGWIWQDDEDDDVGDGEAEEEELDGSDGLDIEILADEADLSDLDSIPRRPPIIPPPPAATVEAPAPIDLDEPLGLGADDLHPDFGRGRSRTNRGEVGSSSSRLALPVVTPRDRDRLVEAPAGDTAEADEEEGSFSLARSATQKIEELDLAPMVDVAFQLVLFFMVTATTVLYKTLEIPKPSAESPASAVAQGRSRSLDDLKDAYILVEIDATGAMKLDREPIEANRENLIELLRRAREKTDRKAMLLSADFSTMHRNAVLAYDTANEIGLSIAIAKPAAPQGPAPTLQPGGGRPTTKGEPGTPPRAAG